MSDRHYKLATKIALKILTFAVALVLAVPLIYGTYIGWVLYILKDHWYGLLPIGCYLLTAYLIYYRLKGGRSA